MGDAEIAPSNDEFPNYSYVILDEDPFGGNTTQEWVLKQIDSFGINDHVYSAHEVTTLDLSQKNHACNDKNGGKLSKKL